MPSILDEPPTAIRDELEDLRELLDRQIPDKALDQNLLIATWNIRAFGRVTRKWQAGEDDSPKRDLHALRVIGEIVSRFDVIALQEVKGNLQALRDMLEWLGPAWGMVLTDVTKGDAGNGERLAYLFDTRKIHMSGLAAELVVPAEQLERGAIDPGALDRQFARTPYAVSFRANRDTFILVALHVLFGDDASDREPELRAIAEWLADWARDVNAYDQNIIGLGDFNIDRAGDELFDAFVSTGLQVPDDLHRVPRTLFADPANPRRDKFYDQIAWFTGTMDVPALSLRYNRGGFFDFTQVALRDRGLSEQQLSWRVSDHYPLWVEFLLRR
ncbi:MAG: endonuclease/exonuclease/phosphatase family protein [Acidobacteriota bacterium]